MPKFSWFALSTEHKKEGVAASFIRERDGLQVFVPAWPAGRSRNITGLLVFPGYILVACEPMLHAANLRTAWYSNGLVQIGGGYPVITDDEISQMKAVIAKGPPPKRRPEVGEWTDIKRGNFRDFSGVVTRVGKDNVTILLSILGQETRTIVPIEDLA